MDSGREEKGGGGGLEERKVGMRMSNAWIQ